MAKLPGYMKLSKWERKAGSNEVEAIITINRWHPGYWWLWLQARLGVR